MELQTRLKSKSDEVEMKEREVHDLERKLRDVETDLQKVQLGYDGKCTDLYHANAKLINERKLANKRQALMKARMDNLKAEHKELLKVRLSLFVFKCPGFSFLLWPLFFIGLLSSIGSR